MEFEKSLKAFIESAKAKAADGLNLEEAFSILIEFVQLAVTLAKDLKNPGPEKRALVLLWVGVLFDNIAPLVPVPFWYVPFQVFVRPLNRHIVLMVAAAFLEKFYKEV
jgi:hypothetical protein